jgi:hypothetical protein
MRALSWTVAVLLAQMAAQLNSAPASAGGLVLAPHAPEGDWRRREIVRTWRDEDGCQLRVIFYHRPDGEVETRQTRDCNKE